MSERARCPVWLAMIALLSPFFGGCTILTQLAEQDRRVTVSIEGALIGPTNVAGGGWDGETVPPEVAVIFADVAVSWIGVGEMPIVGDVARLLGQQLALDLADRISAHFAPPDTWGTVEVFSGGESATFELSKNSNTYTPIWGRAIPNVPIHKSTITITLKDSDLLSSQHMARIILDEDLLLELEDAGGTVALDTRAETGGTIYRLFVRVEKSPR